MQNQHPTVIPSGGKPRGLSLKVACQVNYQATAYMVKMFPDIRLEWLVSETQHLPTYVHLLQAAVYR